MSEHFLSGYCRVMDAPRMVEVVIERGALCDVDCNFENCPFRPSCTVAKEIEEILEK